MADDNENAIARKKRISEALRRAGRVSWAPHMPMSDCEQAFMDRAILAIEVILLRDTINQLRQEIKQAYRGIAAVPHGAQNED